MMAIRKMWVSEKEEVDREGSDGKRWSGDKRTLLPETPIQFSMDCYTWELQWYTRSISIASLKYW